MEYFEGTYTFGKVKGSFQSTQGDSNLGKVIELAPGIKCTVVDEKVSLCHTNKESTHVCFWEGSCEFTVNINGQKVRVNDHDKSETAFVFNGAKHTVQGKRFDLNYSLSFNDGQVHFKYIVWREKGANVNNTGVETHKVGETFTVDAHNNYTTGSTIGVTVSDGLMVAKSSFALSSDKDGAGGKMTYTLVGLTPGRKVIKIHRGRTWEKDSMHVTEKVVNIV